MLLRPAFAGNDIRFVTTDADPANSHGVHDPITIADCNKHKPLSSIICFVQAMKIAIRERPQFVISTGAAPGFFCAIAGRLVGARVLWIDSIANAEKLSMCGSLSRFIAHETLTQWEHLADGDNVKFAGSVL